MLDDPPPPRPLLVGPIAGVSLFALGVIALFTVGRPMGWPLGWWFNTVFIIMGAVFFAVGVAASFKRVIPEYTEHGAEPPLPRVTFTGGGLTSLITGLAIWGGAVFMGSLFDFGSMTPRPHHWAGKASPLDVCQNKPFQACLANGRFLGRFEGVYLAAVERDGRVTDVRFLSKLPPKAKACIAAKVRSLRVRGAGDHRTAVMCQFVGTSMPSMFRISLNPGHRRLAPGEPLVRPRPAPPGGRPASARGPASRPRTSPVAEPNVRATWSEVLASPRCTFFSGPGTLGRDDTLGTAALLTAGRRRATLLLGQGIAFSGHRKRRRLELVRRSDHGRYRVTETLTLEPKAKGRWRGRYHYEECNRKDKQRCPGRCRIQARLALEPIVNDHE